MTASVKLYEINTRVWLRRFDSSAKAATLDDVPFSYWQRLADKGIDYVWLMGIWQICSSTITKYVLKEGPVKDSFKTALPDYKTEDVIGSPYAIDRYQVNPIVGNEESIRHTKQVLNDLGVRLILDFVPNHFSADSGLIASTPYLFLQSDAQDHAADPITFYRPEQGQDLILAHGRDPYFPAWEDTVQVNYFNPRARRFMIDTLTTLTSLCDGVRCDMAMLCLNEIFARTWHSVLSKADIEAPPEEFWEICIHTVKQIRPDFVFMAEAYWDLEGRLQELGFDYTYDKKLTDRLQSADVEGIKKHLWAETAFQKKSVRFIENHDEQRAITALGEVKSKAAAIIISTLQGMHFYYDGQFEGKQVKLPVQLGREPVEAVNREIATFYDRLLAITREAVFREGQWKLLEPLPSWEGDSSQQSILAWQWQYEDQNRLVIVNYSDAVSACRIKPDLKKIPQQFEIVDLLNQERYLRDAQEISTLGLYVLLAPFGAHIFKY